MISRQAKGVLCTIGLMRPAVGPRRRGRATARSCGPRSARPRPRRSVSPRRRPRPSRLASHRSSSGPSGTTRPTCTGRRGARLCPAPPRRSDSGSSCTSRRKSSSRPGGVPHPNPSATSGGHPSVPASFFIFARKCDKIYIYECDQYLSLGLSFINVCPRLCFRFYLSLAGQIFCRALRPRPFSKYWQERSTNSFGSSCYPLLLGDIH